MQRRGRNHLILICAIPLKSIKIKKILEKMLSHFLDLCDHLLKIKFFNFLLKERI
jgi:hypothetical protein